MSSRKKRADDRFDRFEKWVDHGIGGYEKGFNDIGKDIDRKIGHGRNAFAETCSQMDEEGDQSSWPGDAGAISPRSDPDWTYYNDGQDNYPTGPYSAGEFPPGGPPNDNSGSGGFGEEPEPEADVSSIGGPYDSSDNYLVLKLVAVLVFAGGVFTFLGKFGVSDLSEWGELVLVASIVALIVYVYLGVRSDRNS